MGACVFNMSSILIHSMCYFSCSAIVEFSCSTMVEIPTNDDVNVSKYCNVMNIL